MWTRKRSVFGAIFLCGLFGTLVWAAPRVEQWGKVDEAVKKGLPKTAIDALGPIIDAAIQEKAYPEAIKAIAKRISLEGMIQGNKPEEKISRMKAEIDKAPAEMKPMLDAILANWYWHFFQQNRWRFLQRTQTAAPPGDDILAWDLPRILSEIDKQFGRALAAADTLKKTPIADYDALLVKGSADDDLRPTLYDFIAHNALAFYTTGEQTAAKAQDEFDLSADSPVFAPADEFVKWRPETTDEASLTLRAVRLYQDLLEFHARDDDRSAHIDADLWRLHFAYNKARGEEKIARYKSAVKRLAEQHAGNVVSTRALAAWAGVLHSDGELVEAHKVASIGARRFPESVGGRVCHNLIQQIEQPQANLQTERVWNAPWPKIQVRYRNLNKVWFRVVAEDWEARIGDGRTRPEWLDDARRRAALARQPVRQWSVDLPATEDYQERIEEIPAPQDLKPGFYFLLASHDEKFSETNNQVTFTDFWVSDLAIVLRNRHGEGVIEGFVLNALSGEPVVEATVKSWIPSNARRVPGPVTTTDKNGMFRFTGIHQQQLTLLASTREQKLAAANESWGYMQDMTPRPYGRTIFFTDRALYRPGQTIQFKGICIRVDGEKDDYQTQPGRPVSVVFVDPNGKEISRLDLKTNAFGSFSGSFTAPRDRVTGRMRIQAPGDGGGVTMVNVEEYKRPKFQVALDAPKTAAKLGGPVSLEGKATSYTGAAIDGAGVRWRVVRQVRYPDWWGWYFWWRRPQASSQEIAHGTARTGSDGKFSIEFVAKPDTKVLEKDEPTFSYSISADVTDTTGETRSNQRTVNVGYTALKATLSADSWQSVEKPVEIAVSTTTLDGEGQAADAKLKIYRLVQPEQVERPRLLPSARPYRAFAEDAAKTADPKPDPANPNSWALGELVAEQGLTTDAAGKATHSTKLTVGIYRAMLETQDRFGKPVAARLQIQVLDPSADRLAIRVPKIFEAPKWTLEPGEKFTALWGSGYDKARAFVEIEHRNKIVQSFWTDAGKTQAVVSQEVGEGMRGGFTVRVTMVRENRAHLDSRHVDVPWTNKKLSVTWERFTSKLEPGQKEKWTAIVTGPDARKAVAELAATLYDASLDAYQPHHWMASFGVFRQDHTRVHAQFENQAKPLQHLHGRWQRAMKDASLSYRRLPDEIAANFWGYGFEGRGRGLGLGGMPAPAAAMAKNANGVDKLERAADFADRAPEAEQQLLRKSNADAAKRRGGDEAGGGAAGGVDASPDLSKVAARANLNETAFFFPQIVSSKEGEVRLEFTMPEALTEWKFLGFAHDQQLRAGLLQDKVVTSKDLMVQPNPPRFVREGDQIEFTVKVSNQSAARQTGKVRLTLADARTLQSVDAQLGNSTTDQEFDVPSMESRSFSWKLSVPDSLGFLVYKAVGSTGRASDGEEGFLPVLSRRILVRESLPLPIRGQQTKEFDFKKLAAAGKSDSIEHKLLSVQMTSNPSWYAVLALPYLIESPHPCSEQVFNRLYANSLARHVAASDPKIRRVFDQWKNAPLAGAPDGQKRPDPLDSPLMKNQDLKSVMIEETPWYRQAVDESQARRNVGILFDDNRLNDELARVQKQLSEMQSADGAWPWFPGGPANDYMTLYITTGYGRLRHLGVKLDVAPAVKSLGRLDAWIDRTYRQIKNKDQNHLSSTIALYLYGRSFFLKDMPIAAPHKEAVDYYLGQTKKYWLQLPIRQSQAHLAIAAKRFGDKATAEAIMASIKERSVSDEELGMFWRDLEFSFFWFRAPIETQALMIEAFDEVTGDAKSVEDCKVWLLKQKQTQDWKTTKATADAVYALLLRGGDVLASDALVKVKVAGREIKPEAVEAGTGFYERRFVGSEITAQMGRITVEKTDPGVAWGSVHWQYLEDVSKVTSHEATPLRLRKTLYVKRNTKKGPTLEPIQGPVQVGDELVSRIELRTDRDMEYVHLKDHRGSGTEPTNVLSRYKYQDGLAYYESTRDTASHFFIDYLPKGTYVFEYSVRVQHQGRYQTGLATIECMYAPEFNSHSESVSLEATK